jgi:hypothetical protein
MRNMDRTDPAFKNMTEDAKRLKAEIANVNSSMRTQETGIQKLMGTAKGLLPAFGWAAIAAGAVSAFKNIKDSTDTFGTQWDVFVGGLKGAINEFWRTIATGDWSNFTDNMREAIRVGREYQAMLDEIQEKNRALSIIEANSRREALELEDKLRNAQLSNEERTKAGQDRIALEEKLSEQRKKVAQQEYEAELMLTMQQTRLGKERLMEVISDLDSETKAKAKAYNEQLAELEKFDKAKGAVARSGGGAVLMDSDRVKELRTQIQGTAESVKVYADAIRGTGKTTDLQLDKLVASYAKVIDADNSALENTRRVRTQVNSLLNQETKTVDKEKKDQVKIEEEALKKVMTALDQAHQERLLKIEIQAVEEKKSTEWLNLERAVAERSYLEQKLALIQEAGMSGIEIQRKLIERELDLIKQADDEIKRLRNQNINEFEQWLSERLSAEDKALDDSVTANIEYAKKVKKTQEDQVLAERNALADRADAIMGFTANIGDSFQEFLTNQNQSFGDFLKQTLVQTLDFIEKMLIAAIAQETIKSIMEGAPLNPLAVAKAAAKILLLKAAFGVAKAAISGKGKKEFADGGYTGDGDKYEPAGIVHKGEWVAPKSMVKSATTGPIIASLEAMRKSNTQINTPAINALPRGYTAGGYVQAPADAAIKPIGGNNPINEELLGRVTYALQQNTEIMDKLRSWKPKIYTELIKKDLDTLQSIDNKRKI